MNIQQHYQNKANISLNSSLVALVPIVIIVSASFYLRVTLPLLLLVLPFFLYSLICYQAYLLHRQHSLEATNNTLTQSSALLDNTDLLIGFMPAPTLRMVLFNPEGNQVGEIKDSRFWWWRWCLPYFVDQYFPCDFILYDQNKQVMAIYKSAKNKLGMDVFLPNSQKIGSYLPELLTSSFKKQGFIFSFATQQSIFVEGSAIYPDFKFRNLNGSIVGKLVKGWMPTEWGKHFRDANTPFITFDQHIDDTDKLLILGVLAVYFRYTSH